MTTYFWVTLALVLTPGATTAVVIRQVLESGAIAGVRTAAGAALANTTHAAAAGLGLAVLLLRYPAIGTAARMAGAGYLLWLAGLSLRRAWDPPGSLADRLRATRPRARSSPFRAGLAVNLLNPAIATFYLVVVPGFLGPDAGWDGYAMLAAVHVGLAFLCHVAWSALVGGVRAVVRSTRLLQLLDAAAGAALVYLAWRAVA
jgi:threonine/homoserine/homoserine lactone efflux protein